MGGKHFARHAKKLSDTISSIVEEAAPAVICMCEVGLPHSPLQSEHFARLRNVVAQAWKDCCPAAKEHGVEFLYTDGEPYLSAYRPDMITCTAHTTMQDLYLAGGEPRTAQHFLATPACGGYSGANIINVHAPSGTRRLKDSQRLCLLTRLLQSTSLRDSRMRVGMDNFIIGGDINTEELLIACCLRTLRQENVCSATARSWRPHWGMHGDIGIVGGGVQGGTLEARMRSHDPTHVPYAFGWKLLPEQACAPATEQHAAEQEPLPAALAQHGPPLANETAEEPAAAQQSATDAAGEDAPAADEAAPPAHQSAPQPPEADESSRPSTDELIAADEAPPPAHQSAPQPPEADESPRPSTDELIAADEASPPAHQASAPATEQRADKSPRPSTDDLIRQATERRHAELVFRIVDAFFGGVTCAEDAAFDAFESVLEAGRIPPAQQLSFISEMFEPIFLHYPGGVSDRSIAYPRDAVAYINNWRQLALFRSAVDASPHWNPRPGTALPPEQRQRVFQAYLSDFRDNHLNPGQAYKKNIAEARLRNLAGTRAAAFVIWELGIPSVRAVLATEQPARKTEMWSAGARDVLSWLARVAQALRAHASTPEYQEAVRRGGTTRGRSGLTQAEQDTQSELQRAVTRRSQGARLARQWDAWEVTYYTVTLAQWRLLGARWAGWLDDAVDEIRRRRGLGQLRMPQLDTN